MAAPFTSASAAPTLADTLFQRDLGALVRHLRASPDLSSALSRALSDSLREVLSPDPDTKSAALLKLSFLYSLHHLPLPPDAAFHALHLLPSPSPFHKRIAYLSASLSFPALPDALLLSTNQLRKDLSSPSPLPPCLALHLLSHASSPELSRDLAPDLLALLSSPRASLRVKALAAVPCALSRQPDWIRAALPRIADALSSPDPRTLSAAVSSVTELSACDPQLFLPLAPQLYKILVDCKNNWVLIKVLKVFSRLYPLEPRLGRKIVEPVCEHMRRSPAKSMVFECARVVFTNLSGFEHAVRLAVEKVGEFLAGDDPNLLYLGLQGLAMLGLENSWAVEESREVVVRALGDKDPNIQREALKLVMGLICESNVVEVCNLLVKQAGRSDPMFANEILGAILETCGRNFYELVVDFEWYVSLIGEISRSLHCMKGEEIERQLVDIGMRVKDVRMELVLVARDLLIDPALLGNPFLSKVLSAAAWIAGEYVEFARNPVELVEALLQPRTSLLPDVPRAIYIHAVCKIIVFCYSSYLEGSETVQLLTPTDPYGETRPVENSSPIKLEESANSMLDEGIQTGSNYDRSTCHKVDSFSDFSQLKGIFSYTGITSMLSMVKIALLPLTESDDVEVQERSRNVLGLIHTLQEFQTQDLEKETPINIARTLEVVRLMQDSISEELGPVPVSAQERVPMPDDITFLKDLTDIRAVLGNDEAETVSTYMFLPRVQHSGDTREELEPSTESTSLLAEHRKRHGLYYLQVEKEETNSSEYPHANEIADQVNIPTDNTTDDLLKLTQKSLNPQRIKPVKSRPTVIRLDEENCPPSSSLKIVEPKTDLLSSTSPSAVVDGGDKPTSSKKNSSRSSRRIDKETSVGRDVTSVTRKSLGDSGSGSNRSRDHRHGKERRRNVEEDADIAGKNNCSMSHGSIDPVHPKQKNKHKTDACIDLIPQTSTVEDLLLQYKLS